jgi:hypothetical protein
MPKGMYKGLSRAIRLNRIILQYLELRILNNNKTMEVLFRVINLFLEDSKYNQLDSPGNSKTNH